MPIVVYDNRDHPTDKYWDVTFRIYDADGRLLASGMIFADDPRAFAADLAAKTGEALEYLGPDEPKPTPPVNRMAKLDELRESNREAKQQQGLF